MTGTRETARKAAAARHLFPLLYIDERDDGFWVVYANGKEYRHSSLAEARQLHNAHDAEVRDRVRQDAFCEALRILEGYKGHTLSPEQERALRSYDGPEICGSHQRTP